MAKFFGRKRRRRTRACLARLSRHEAGQVMDHGADFPVVVARARGARVTDADGNHYVDLSSFFGVCSTGHRNHFVMRGVQRQAGRLWHAMGDVHPPDIKASFLAELARWLPEPEYKMVLSLNGSDAVECALKFAYAATSKPGVITFERSYHGLSLGALHVTGIGLFREQFGALLDADRVSFVPFPTDSDGASQVLERIDGLAREGKFGCILVEPVQGRGGIRVPPKGFLAALADLCKRREMVLITDEIFTGVGRTGRFLAAEHDGVAADCICLGKALGGGLPLSVCAMKPWVADAVRRPRNEAVHTSTFLGHPLACAAGRAVLAELRRHDLIARGRVVGERILARAQEWQEHFDWVLDVRGLGPMIGVEMAGERAREVQEMALERGVILMCEGVNQEVLAFLPPFVIESNDLDFALTVVEECLRELQR